ncbi:MAG: 16S rRNA (cytidine(1402)-2'-O)-methyltransferase [Armatimonadetes bacterium CG_4_9_14_3_um_filter_66_14]|nr:MAG: 16S rRNA (cytidine(1402)-2'-O)-methyltransferase [Armatimonadetes bacterium CG_4_9_14_3_um_filter_66_14]
MAESGCSEVPGKLFVCATPLGNLEDVSLRLLRVLGECAVIAAEDTRVTRKLLAHHDLHTPLLSCHQHSGPDRLRQLVERLLGGQSVALVCNAGTPTISDPGAALVEAALEAGISLVPVPGPAAVTSAVSVSGLPAARFWFQGFLPRRGTERRETLERLAAMGDGAIVIYESPRRLGATLTDLTESLGDRRAVVCRELTKKFEEVVRGSLVELAEWARGEEVRGEVTIVVSPPDEVPAQQAPGSQAELSAALSVALEDGLSVRDAVRRVAAELSAPRNAVYKLAQELPRG